MMTWIQESAGVWEWTAASAGISVVLFFGIFMVATWRAYRRPRAEVQHLAQLPLEDGKNAEL
ncbi:MAG: hypothetical protein WCI73_17650 [Phycisphaerae bacterium]